MFYRKVYLFLSFFFTLTLTSLTLLGQSHSAAVNKLSEGLGNIKSLNAARFIMFSSSLDNHDLLQGEHTYLFDWRTKECRFEGETKEGKILIVLFNAKNQTGEVYLDKMEIEAPEILKDIVHLFTEDSYFLFTPMLIAGNKINSTIEESEIIGSKRYFVLKVNSSTTDFDYSKLYIDAQDGTISKWETFDHANKRVQDLVISKVKDVGGGLTLATKFTDRVNGKSFQYPIVSALLNIESEKFKTP